MKYLNCGKEKINLEFSSLVKLSFKSEREAKTFQTKKLNKFVASKIA